MERPADLDAPGNTTVFRFWKSVNKTDGCWEWVGYLRPSGYGIMSRVGYRYYAVHRLSWEIHNGFIPAGLFVCHHCDNRKCVRPDHLFLGTNDDNMKDAVKKGRYFRRRLMELGDTCRKGHAISDENTRFRYTEKEGWLKRTCRVCLRERERAETARNRELRALPTDAKEPT